MNTAALSMMLAVLAPLATVQEAERHEKPAGWQVRLDRPNADLSAVAFWTMPPGWHITTGPACILYDPSRTAEGQYHLRVEIFLFDPGERREAFGVFLGGKNLGGDNQSYDYFLIRRDGRYLIKRRAGSRTRLIRPWTVHRAIVKYDGSSETAKNVLTIEVGAEEVDFFVNGQMVTSLPRLEVNTDGIVGLRVNHALNLHVSELTVERRVRASTTLAATGQLLEKLGLGQKKELSVERIASGLKEALRVGTDNTVRLTGRPDGYFRNEAIKILMPEKLRTLERGLRAVGYGSQVDEFILSMNRAAERAAPHAKDIFWDAILEMSFDDARQVLSGGDTAATDYFRAKTTDKLAITFRPIVREAMNEVGVTRQYKQLVGRAQAIPFVKSEPLDIDEYVVAKALEGLFHVLAEEERKIREEPAARVTDVLKEVFGR